MPPVATVTPACGACIEVSGPVGRDPPAEHPRRKTGRCPLHPKPICAILPLPVTRVTKDDRWRLEMDGAVSDDGCAASVFAPQVVRGNHVTRRDYDGLVLLRLSSDHGVMRIPVNADPTRWPVLAIYAISSVELRPQARTSTLVLQAGSCYFFANLPTCGVSLVGSADVLVIHMPADVVFLHQRMLDRTEGCVCSPERGTAQLVGKLLEGLAASVETYEPANPARFAHSVLGLLTLMLADSVCASPPWSKPMLLERSKDYIERHLADTDLTPARIASAVHMSSRNLHRIFEVEGLTVGGWIRRRRLDHCRLDLGDSALGRLPVSHIAARWGLWEAAHFSRLFKAAYGMSPSAYRAMCAARAGVGRAVQSEPQVQLSA